MQDTRIPSSTGFRRRCAAGRVTLERPKVTKGLLPRLFALLRRVPSVQVKGRAERRRRYIPVPPASAPSSMTALLTLCPHLGEQEGAKPNPQHRGQLTAPVYSEQRSGGLLSLIQPLATVWQDQIVALIQQAQSTLLHRCKNEYEYNGKWLTSISGNGFILKARY